MENRKYPLPTVVDNPEQFPSVFDKANEKLENNSSYSRQQKILAMNRENPDSEELKKEVQAQLKPMPVCEVLTELDLKLKI